MPFCSHRCRLLDLANWADERYLIAEPLRADDWSELESELPPSGDAGR